MVFDVTDLKIKLKMKSLMPVLFVGHGSPMNAIEETEFSRGWKNIAGNLPRPDSILCISAHWETRGTHFTAMEKPETIHDFGGFPDALYQVDYPAPGNPLLAREINDSLKFTESGLDLGWGLDHGTWSVLRWMYPDADVPVVQMSLDYLQKPEGHFNLARELMPLRQKGVLIIGSGNIVHNLRMADWTNPNGAFEWAIYANKIIKKAISEGDNQLLTGYNGLGREINLAIPTPEHFIPLLYTLALRDKDEEVSLFNDRIVMGSLSMTSVFIGS
jgi:4,5-DOPA dioxygenase extradiol